MTNQKCIKCGSEYKIPDEDFTPFRPYCKSCLINEEENEKKIKKKRKIKSDAKKLGLSLEEYDKKFGKCEICGFSGTVDIHHKDKNTDNKSLDNLISLCPNHHYLLHRGIKNLDELMLEKNKREKSLKDIQLMSNTGGYLSIDEVKNLCRSPKNPKDRVFLWTLFDSGRRVSEWISIRWKDIKWDRRIVVSPILKKGNFIRIEIPLGKTSMSLLSRYKELLEKGEIRIYKKVDLSPEGLLFPFTRQYANNIIKRAAKRAGIDEVGEKKKKMHCHVLRHSRAVSFVKAGMPVTQLQSFMAHSNIATTTQYLQYSGDDKRRLRDKCVGMD